MRNPCNRAVFEHFGQGTQLTLHDYSAERLESVLMEFLARFAEKRSILFSAFAEIKAGQGIDTESFLGDALGKLYTKNRTVRVDEFSEVVGEVDRHICAIRGRVEGNGRLLLLELAQYFILASEKFGLVDRALGTDPVSERGSFAELVLCLWDATMNNEMWVDVNTIPDHHEVDRIRKGRFLLQSVGIVPAGLDNASGVAQLLQPFETWIDLEAYLVFSLCRAIRSAISPNVNAVVESIIRSGSERQIRSLREQPREVAAARSA